MSQFSHSAVPSGGVVSRGVVGCLLTDLGCVFGRSQIRGITKMKRYIFLVIGDFVDPFRFCVFRKCRQMSFRLDWDLA